MRIAFLVDQFPKLSETFMLTQITALIDRGHEVHIFALSPSGEPDIHEDVSNYDLLSKTIYAPGLSSRYLDRLRRAVQIWRSTFGRPTGTRDRRALLRTLNVGRYGREAAGLRLFHKAGLFSGGFSYDLIHCHFGPTGLLGARLRDLYGLKVPLFTTFYGFDLSRFLRERGPAVYDELFRAKGEVISITRGWIPLLSELGCSVDRIHWHPLGVDTSAIAFHPRPVRSERVRLLTIARLVEKKGIPHAIGALQRLVEADREIELRIVGDGPMASALSDSTRDLGLVRHVHFLGPMTSSQVMGELVDADILLVPSVTAPDGDQEGTPTVILEAFAVGRVVIATHHGGIPEIVQDGETGLVVSEGDEKGLAESVERILKDSALASRLVQNGRAYVESNHDSRRLAADLEKLYVRAVSPQHTGAEKGQ